MENVFLTSLTVPEIKKMFRDEIENYFEKSNHAPVEKSEPDLLRYIPIQDIFNRKICSKPTFYAHLKNGEFTLYKFGNKSFIDRAEFERAFHGVRLNAKKGDIK